MIICICNNISDKSVQSAKANGCNSLKEVCNYLGLDVQCGTCLKKILEEIGDEKIL